MPSDESVALYRLWRETFSRLESFGRRVDEGQDVLAALDFARYVFWSGLSDYLEARVGSMVIKVEKGALESLRANLEKACLLLFERSPGSSAIHETQMEAVNRKLDVIAAFVSKQDVAGQPSGAER